MSEINQGFLKRPAAAFQFQYAGLDRDKMKGEAIMRRFFVLLAGALALAAGAGLSLPSAANDTEGVVPKLELVHSISRGRRINISAFSEDGSTFLAAGETDGVRLYRTSNFELLEEFDYKRRFLQQ